VAQCGSGRPACASHSPDSHCPALLQLDGQQPPERVAQRPRTPLRHHLGLALMQECVDRARAQQLADGQPLRTAPHDTPV
jgi:hypothetical protein